MKLFLKRFLVSYALICNSLILLLDALKIQSGAAIGNDWEWRFVAGVVGFLAWTWFVSQRGFIKMKQGGKDE
jgi:hypothetical protein